MAGTEVSGRARRRRVPRMAGAAAVVGVAAAVVIQGCTLPDMPLDAGEEVLVVEAVLRTDRRVQQILLHRAIAGRVAAGEPGARVAVVTGAGREIPFEYREGACFHAEPHAGGEGASALEGEVRVDASCYFSPRGGAWDQEWWVEPGGTYDLVVETPRGERVRGRTVVPGAFALPGLPHAARDDRDPPPCTLAPATELPVRWTTAAGAWAYVSPLRIRGLAAALEPLGIEAPEPLDLVGISVSAADTSIVLPTEFGVFDRFRLDQDLLRALQGGFPPGVRLSLSVAAADRNYVNGVRGGSFNPSGRVRISSVAGDGVGVFGSLVPLHARIRVGPPQPGVPPCGGG
jgi:hypothetical protein